MFHLNIIDIVGVKGLVHSVRGVFPSMSLTPSRQIQ